jgi:hypothetical protein
MPKYHISPSTGNPNKCSARDGYCPFGDETVHFSTKEEARTFYESEQEINLYALAPQRKVGDEIQFKTYSESFYSDYGRSGVITKITAKNAIIEDKHGQFWKVKRTDEGWVGNDRIINPKNYPRPTVDSLAKAIDVPEGYSLKKGKEDYFRTGEKIPTLTLTGDGVEIKIIFDETTENPFTLASGHVDFSTVKGVRTFDRRGIEDSFYVNNPDQSFSDEGDPNQQVNETIQDFITKRIPESRERLKNSETIPGIGLMTTPEKKAKLLKEGRVEFVPGGFGTGYVFTTKATPGSRPASPAQKEFFNTPTLYVETFDYD